MKFIDASPAAVDGEARLPGIANYFVDKDPSKWRSKVPTFAKVRIAAIYPGIDALFSGHDGELEYDLVVAPGADPSRVRLAFEGASGLKLDSNGDLVATVGSAPIRVHKPAIYQITSGGRKEIGGEFERRARGEFGLRVAEYDHSRQLVIDPTISYSVSYATYVSGSGFDVVNSSTIDRAGNYYLTGICGRADIG